jgi:hypothetical protein
MGYNRFGAVYTDVIALYTGTVVGDFGTQQIIEAAIDEAVDMVAGALAPTSYAAITDPTLEQVVTRATAGQTTCQLGITPVITSQVHVWSGQPILFQIRPRLLTESIASYAGGLGLGNAGQIMGPQVELDASQFSVNSAGLVTLNRAMSANDVVYATYRADTTNASYAFPSLARIAVRGAAAELGARLYTDGTQSWDLVKRYAEQFSMALENLRAGTLIPDEIRLMRWFSEVERASNQGGSIRISRG